MKRTTNDLLETDRGKIREHWKKSNAQIQLEVGIIRSWIKTQKHLPEIPNDNVIECYLINCKFSIEKAKRAIDMYYTVPDLIPDLYTNKHPRLAHMKKVFEKLYVFPLPRLTDDLYRVILAKHRDSDSSDFYPVNYNAFYQRNLFEVKINEDLSLGEVVIIDYENVSLGQLAKVTPLLLKKAVFVLENVCVNRMKGIHLLNCPPLMSSFIEWSTSFLSDKLKKRVFVHKKIDDLFKIIPQELLPSDYGGKEISLKELEHLWLQKFEEYYDRFDKMENLKVNEKLRPEKLVNSDVLGYYGNFKTIEID